MNKRYVSYLMPIILAACGGGGGNTGTAGTPAPIATVTPAPTSTPAVLPTPLPSPTTTTIPTGWAAQAAALYDVQPDAASCRPGTLKASVKGDFLARLNAIRALHRLPAVTYADGEDGQQAESSLMMAVNRTLSHTPPANWLCYTAAGAAGAGASNLIGGWGTGLGFNSEEDYLANWLHEGGSASIGHRRWILSPFLGKTSYGRVATVLADGSRASAASMRVFNFTGGVPLPSGVPPFVAYPYGDYPNRYFRVGDYLSFTAVPSVASNFANNSVNFARATVVVTGPGGTLAVSDVGYDTDGYGVPNNIQWRVAGLQPGVSYNVRIAGVTGSAQSEYSYTFRVVN